MRTENNVPPAFSISTDAHFEDGIQADVYRRHERPVAIVLWRGNEPQPYAAFKDSDDGRLVRFAVTANDDVPRHDRRETHLNVQVHVHTDALNNVRGVALYRDESQLLLVVTGAGSPMRLHPFNERANGIFANDFRDIDGLPVADVFGASVRAILHGRDARAWSVPQTAKLVAEYPSDQMARLMEVVNVRSRDDAWRSRYQDHGLAGSEELVSILSSRWPHVHTSSEQLPLVRVDVAPNTYSFYVSSEEGGKKLRVHQFTDFRGSMLEADFPLGSSNEWRVPMPGSLTDMDVVNAAGRSLLKDWATIPKSFPAADAPPYDPYDMDAAMDYTRRTRGLFAQGNHEEAYAHYMRDPNGGANKAFRQTTKGQFVVEMYSARDVQGRPVHPQPKGYQHAGFTVGHEAHLRDDKSWVRIAHLFEFDGKPYVMLEFDQPVSAFTDAEGRLKVLRGVAAAQAPAARDTRLMVAADQIDGTRVPTRDLLFREDGTLRYLSYSKASGKRNAALMLSCRTDGLPSLTTSLIVDGRDFREVYGRAVKQLANAFGVADEALLKEMHATVDTFLERLTATGQVASAHAVAAIRDANGHLTQPPEDDDEFDAYMANEHFHNIQRVEVMEGFLLRAARRFHVLNAEQSAATSADLSLPAVKQKAWEFLHDQFIGSISDLRMFFSETDDYWHLNAVERKRLDGIADALVDSGRDPSKIVAAEELMLTKPGRPLLSNEQRSTLLSFKESHGPTWKGDLNEAWVTGDRSWDALRADALHHLRDALGYKWLMALADEDLVSDVASSAAFIDGQRAALAVPGASARDGALTEAQRAAALTLIDAKIASDQQEREMASYDTQNAIGVAYSLLRQIRGAILEGKSEIDIRSHSGGSLHPAAESYDSAYDCHLSALSHLSSFIDCLDELEIIHVAHEYREEMPSAEQRAAVAAFCDANGSDWKEKLSALWMSGNYSRRGIDTEQAALLQQVRNEFGPEWLANVRRTDLGVECNDADLSM